jgi:hypothetical protein
VELVLSKITHFYSPLRQLKEKHAMKIYNKVNFSSYFFMALRTQWGKTYVTEWGLIGLLHFKVHIEDYTGLNGPFQ